MFIGVCVGIKKMKMSVMFVDFYNLAFVRHRSILYISPVGSEAQWLAFLGN